VKRWVYFSYDATRWQITIGESALAPKIDHRADGGYAIALPSLHESGVAYRWNMEHARSPNRARMALAAPAVLAMREPFAAFAFADPMLLGSYTWCMNPCMRTNVVLNEELIEEAMKYSTARSRSALIEEALRAFVQSRAAERRKASYERRLLELRQRLGGVVTRESAQDIVRRDRERK